MRTILALLLTTSMIRAECSAYWYSKQQEKAIHADLKSWQLSPITRRMRMSGKLRKVTARTVIREGQIHPPVNAFSDYHLVGKVCGENH